MRSLKLQQSKKYSSERGGRREKEQNPLQFSSLFFLLLRRRRKPVEKTEFSNVKDEAERNGISRKGRGWTGKKGE